MEVLGTEANRGRGTQSSTFWRRGQYVFPLRRDYSSIKWAHSSDKQSHRVQSCRIQLSLQGFEWFLYNRTAAYENILAHLHPQVFSRPASRTTEPDTKPPGIHIAVILSYIASNFIIFS
jgi:hypothetical protein